MKTRNLMYTAVAIALVAASLGTISPVSAAGWQCASTATVQWGDTWYSIARLCGISVADLQAANPGVWMLYAGSVIYIPHGAPAPGYMYSSHYVVLRGDTLRIIANRYGISLWSLIAANPQIPDPNWIYAGMTIHIPSTSWAPYYPSLPPPASNTYIVQHGDTLRIIAARFGTTWQSIAALNPQLWNPNLIYPGQVIRIF